MSGAFQSAPAFASSVRGLIPSASTAGAATSRRGPSVSCGSTCQRPPPPCPATRHSVQLRQAHPWVEPHEVPVVPRQPPGNVGVFSAAAVRLNHTLLLTVVLAKLSPRSPDQDAVPGGGWPEGSLSAPHGLPSNQAPRLGAAVASTTTTLRVKVAGV